MLEKHAPRKKCIRKELKLAPKPWVTYGIKNSISVRHKLYMEMIKAKNDQTKKRKHEIYTTLRNKIINLLRVSRKCYYQKYFEEKKKSSRAIWEEFMILSILKKVKRRKLLVPY